ncbi:MAG: sigma-70 family RNA polymerase sigma factor [Deltaproteobacteria bacterium]|nr:sigma-70 family RNA polymerase sigma factor [Deltaproteobacteria bacterium]
MVHEERSDWECVQKVQGGDADAFETLVRRHEKKIFNLLYRWLGDYDEAADVAQEVFLAAFRAIKRFRGDSSFATWLYRIGVNHAKNRQKSLQVARQRQQATEVSDPPGDPTSDPAERVEQRERQHLVQRGLNDLDADDALLILLHDLQEVRYEEISETLDIPLGTVKSRLHRARQALRAKLAPYFGRKKWQ